MSRRAWPVAAIVAGFMLAAVAAPPADAAAWRTARVTASCYGPGLYGNGTADGTRLTIRTEGIAHRTLPLGTVVILAYGRRATLTRVIDRGPFHKDESGRYDRDVDVTARTARRLGFRSCRVFGVRTITLWRYQ